MIATREEYVFNAPPQGIIIDGGILPARDVASDGSWRVLRGEDPCFLAEAASRMWAYRDYFTSLRAPLFPVSSSIRAYDISSAYYYIIGNSYYPGGNRVFYKNPIGASEFIEGVGGSSGITVALNSLAPGMASVPSFVGDVSAFMPDKPLVADELRKVWYDFRQFGAVLATCDSPRGYVLCKSGGRTRTHYPDRQPPETEGWVAISGGASLNVYEAWTHYTGVWAPNNGWVEYDFTIGTVKPSSSTATTQLSFAAGNNAVLFLRVVTTYTENDGGQAVGTETFYDSLGCKATIDADGLLQMSTLAGGELTADFIRGKVFDAHTSLPSTYAAMPANRVLSIYVSPAAVFFYDPGIDTSAINWQWTPQGV